MRVYEPERANYRKKIGKAKICEFCDAGNIKRQECKVLSETYWIVMVNIYPYMDGNLMLIPKRHVKNLEDLSRAEWAEFPKVLLKTKKVLCMIFDTDDYNVGLNIGKNAGSSIDHLHWQIFPRRFAGTANAANIMADLHIITMKPEKLKKLIGKALKKTYA